MIKFVYLYLLLNMTTYMEDSDNKTKKDNHDVYHSSQTINSFIESCDILKEIIKITKQTPNDSDLGYEIRNLIKQIKNNGLDKMEI